MKTNKVAEVQITYTSGVSPRDRRTIRNKEEAFEVFWDNWDKGIIEHQEQVKILFLNRGNQVIGITTLSSGGLSGCIIDPKLVFQYVLKTNSHGFILCHNHPSGNTKPSEQDIRITEKIKSGSEILDITFLDHLIITPSGDFSSIL